jgi:hypothetical protein
MQRRNRGKGPASDGGLRHPGSVFEHFSEGRDKGLGGHRVKGA